MGGVEGRDPVERLGEGAGIISVDACTVPSVDVEVDEARHDEVAAEIARPPVPAGGTEKAHKAARGLDPDLARLEDALSGHHPVGPQHQLGHVSVTLLRPLG